MSDGPGDWGEVAELRQGIYRFLAGAFLPPASDRLETLANACAVLDEMGIDGFAFARQWHELEASLDVVVSVEGLEAEYVRLFMAGTDGPLSPPTESQYAATNGGCGGGEVAGALSREYAAFGLQLTPHLPFQPDHVAVELDAMASLCHQEVHDWAEGTAAATVATLRREWTFLDRHLVRWLPAFAERVRVADAGGFYTAVVDAATAFVRHDFDLVSLLARGDGTGR